MFNFSEEILEFWGNKIKLSKSFRERLFEHRKANRDRLIGRLPEQIEGISINNDAFKPQGSMTMRTIIQTRFSDEEYDIDDGLILQKDELHDSDGKLLDSESVRESVREALKDDRFNKQPKLYTNCVRVFYADEDKEKHHVDFPIYRISYDEDDNKIQELANSEKWIESDPTQVNFWFENEVITRNQQVDGKGSQLRKLIQLLKRFARSRREWDMPNGMKLTMLAVECQKRYYQRIDKAFRELCNEIKERLMDSKEIYNLAHPDKPKITKTSNDENVCNFEDKIIIALSKLDELDNEDCTKNDAKRIWDWIFKSDGFFDGLDLDRDSNKSEGFAYSNPRQVVEHYGGGRFA